MDEIALLQQQLAAVQHQDAALKLSDHNVVDLLLKLQQLGKLHVIHTRTGKQFLTFLQVQREIADYVALYGGRVSLTELEKLIDVDRVHVEKQAIALCRSSKSHKDTYSIVNSGEELLTSWYLDGIIEDTNILLQQVGTTTIGDLAQQFGLAVDYMRDVVRTRLGSILKAKERDNVLYTDTYVTAQKAQLRGVFAAITRPVFVPDILRSYGIDESVANEALTELLQTQAIMGTLRGREYVPYVFMTAQKESVYSFFQQNGYLEHARAKKLQVARPYDFLKKRFLDAVPLQESVVSHELQLQLEGAIEAVINDKSLVDVRTLLPSALSESDVGLLLSMSPLLDNAGRVSKAFQIAEFYAVSAGFFALCLEKFGENATLKASHVAAQQKSTTVQSGVRDWKQETEKDYGSDGDEYDKKRGKKGKRVKDWNTRDQKELEAHSAKTRKSKTGKRGSKGSGNTGGDRDSAAASTEVSIVPSRAETIELLLEWFPALEDYEGDDDFFDGILAFLKPKIHELHSAALTKALSCIIRGDAASLRELRKSFEEQFDEQFTKLLVLEKGFNKFSALVDVKNLVSMAQLALVETHLLDSIAVKLAALVTCFIAESNNIELQGVPLLSSLNNNSEGNSNSVAPITSLSKENKKVLEASISQSTASTLVRLWTLATAGRRSINDFVAHIPVLAGALNIPLHKLDRKKERQVIFSYRQDTLAELDRNLLLVHENSLQYSLLVSLILQLYFQQRVGLPITFPSDTLSYGDILIKAFQDYVPEKVTSILRDLVNIAVPICSVEDSADAQKSKWSERLEAARALVLLKDLNSV
ncbi:hypothetical protein CCR75_005214 [Bremia lactucae]|uniref:E3 UFM1-protein ligase 1 homolog n=1 Tax=Bremia lactucae TaxID=4779 RepID=A0A976IBV3_BRELC|nr:hypothetical protein CCR75_005214 [Bremia lactucae]